MLYVKYGWNRSKEWWLIDYHHFHLQKRSIRRMRCQRHSKYIGVFIIQHWLHHVSSQSSIGVCCTTVSDRIRKLYSGNTRESIVCVRHDPDSNWAEELYKWLLISVYMHLQDRTRPKTFSIFNYSYDSGERHQSVVARLQFCHHAVGSTDCWLSDANFPYAAANCFRKHVRLVLIHLLLIRRQEYVSVKQ